MSTSRSSSTLAIVLKRSNVGESDRILTLLTQTQGKISCVAKGVRKISSSNRANVEPGNLINAFLISTKSLPLLTQTRLINDFSQTKKTLPKMRQLTQILEMVDRLFVENTEDESLFQEVIEILKHLNLSQQKTSVFKNRLHLLITKLGYQSLADSGHDSLLDYIADISEKPMRSWEYLQVK